MSFRQEFKSYPLKLKICADLGGQARGGGCSGIQCLSLQARTPPLAAHPNPVVSHPVTPKSSHASGTRAWHETPATHAHNHRGRASKWLTTGLGDNPSSTASAHFLGLTAHPPPTVAYFKPPEGCHGGGTWRTKLALVSEDGAALAHG